MNPIPLLDESRLVDLINTPSVLQRRWDERAACAEMPGGFETYFPEDGAPSVAALARCLGCAVAHECLATALIYEATDNYRFGWWGGFGPDEREHVAQRLGISVGERIVVPDEPADLARHLRASNYTIPAIAAELGCTERTVYRYLAKFAA